MDLWSGDSREDLPLDDDEQPSGPSALVGTEGEIPIDVLPMKEEPAPDGTISVGTFISGRLVARNVVPLHIFKIFKEGHIFAQPVRLILVARESPPGLRCRLFALVPLPSALNEEEVEEPWAASVPSSKYERVAAAEESQQGGSTIVAIPLGDMVRTVQGRLHPSNLTREAAVILSRVVSGRVVEVVDKTLEDLLGS